MVVEFFPRIRAGIFTCSAKKGTGFGASRKEKQNKEQIATREKASGYRAAG